MHILGNNILFDRLGCVVAMVAFLLLGCSDSDSNSGWVNITGPTSDGVYELLEYQEILEISGEAFSPASTTGQQCYCPDITFMTCLLFGMWICGEEYTVENRATIYIVNRTMDAKGIVMSHGSPWVGGSLIQSGENYIEVKAVDDAGNYGVDTLKVITKYDPSGLPHWIRILGEVENDTGAGIAIDIDGNSYVVGNTSTAYGLESTFLTKYDISGNQLWLKQYAKTSDSYISHRDIAADKNGRIYITGEIGNTNSYDVFIAKYDGSGNQLWLKQFGTATYDISQNVAVDMNGNSYISGITFGNLGGIGVPESRNIFIAKYDGSGNQLWLKQFEGDSSESDTKDIAVDSYGDSYILGKAIDDLVCPGGVLSLNHTSITKLDSYGNQIWQKPICTEYLLYGGGITVDTNGNSYITGRVNIYSNWLGSNDDAFIAKYDTLGNQLWLKLFGTNDFDMGTDVSINQGGSIDVVGWTYDEVRTSADVVDDDALFIAKYDASGQQIVLKQFYAPHQNSGQVNKIKTDELGASYVMSSFYSNANRNDVYIMRLNP